MSDKPYRLLTTPREQQQTVRKRLVSRYCLLPTPVALIACDCYRYGETMSSVDATHNLISQDMRNTWRLPVGGLFLFMLLSMADLSLTWFLLTGSNGKIYESNPIAAAWLATYGWAGLVLYKVLGLFLVA